LSSRDIEAVVDFVRSEFMHIESSVKQPVSVLPAPAVSVDRQARTGGYFPAGLKGSVLRGEDFYQNNCFSCHGRSGKGDGPRAHFNQPRPRDFTSDETRVLFDRERLFNRIRTGKQGTVMPAWDKVLTEQQIADVAEYVWQQFIQLPKKKS